MRELSRLRERRAKNLSRNLVTTLLMIALAVLIVRDIVARRFSGTAPPAPDVTDRSR
jgi:hypothetical protein